MTKSVETSWAIRARNGWGILLAALLLSSGALFPIAARADLLNDEQLIALLNNATLDLTNVIGDADVIRHHFQPVSKVAEHGKVDVVLPHGYDVERGIWWVEEEQFCVLYKHIITVRKRCFAVQREGDANRFIELRYELPGQKVVRPHQFVQTARLTRVPEGQGVFHLLDDQELITLLSGAHVRVKGHDSPKEVIFHLSPVTKPSEHGSVGNSTSLWWVEDEEFCVYVLLQIGARKRCFAVASDGGNYRIIETRWEQPGKVVERLHQWVPSGIIFRAVGG